MRKQKVVIIAGEIFPRISPRSFRATELAKAMAKKGHEVILYGALGQYDYSSFEKKYKVTVKDLGTSRFAYNNSDGSIKLPLWKLGLIFFLRKLIEFPDIFLAFKTKKAILKENYIDTLITIAVPYPIHWGAALLKEKQRNFKTWISDCGDPYMFNSIKKPFFYYKYIEKFWSKKTDYIAVPIEGAKKSYYEEYRDKVVVIPQGFNFEELTLATYKPNTKPTFFYAGMFYPEKRDPTNFLKYLCTLKEDFTFIVYTNKRGLLTPFQEVLKEKLDVRDSIGREELIFEMSKSDFLINIKNKGMNNQSPSKLIDYSFSKRPVLELSSDFIKEEQEHFQSFLKQDYAASIHFKDLSYYDAKNVASQFLNLSGR